MNTLLGYQDQTQSEEIYLAIRRLKREKLSEQRQAVGINKDLLIKMIAQHLNLLQEEENRGAKMVADWHRQSLMHPNALNTMEEEEIELSAVQQLPVADPRLTPLIATR